MKAVGYQKAGSINAPSSLVNLEVEKPVATGHDILVAVKAISVNPVDTKIRGAVNPEKTPYKILGWDVAGVVEAVGDAVSLFKPGDQVWYAGAIHRAGGNAEFHLVDERIVSLKPTALDFKAAAAMPLTAITAWELLFDRLGVTECSTGNLLVIGGAGGVGSMLIQLAKQLTNLTVIATASRPESIAWVKSLGADIVVNHHHLAQDLADKALGEIQFVASLTNTELHLATIVDVIAPQGKLAVIDDPKILDIKPFKQKSVSVHWEFMYTRSLFNTPDMLKQHELLGKVAQMVDAGQLVSTMKMDFGQLCAENLTKAHQLIESGQAIGKVVLAGF